MHKDKSAQLKNPSPLLADAHAVLRIEAEGILRLADRLDNRFTEMVELIYNARGRLIVGGIGKSGIVGRKIVATLNSTGTRALSIHPVEAMHGDLGMVGADDVFLALSNSGETDELNLLLPSIRRIGCKIIAFTGNSESTLAKYSDIVIDTGVAKEACPLGLAPTASTTAQLVMGDALAVVLLNKHKFQPSDFKKIHPGGALGQRLAGKIKDIMLKDTSLPAVNPQTELLSAIKEVDRHGMGVCFVLEENKTLVGIITDGDIRRWVARDQPLTASLASDIMTADPFTLDPETPTYDALYLMEKHEITVLPITAETGKVLGLLHLHDILGKGEFKFNGK